jgi:PhnB protein
MPWLGVVVTREELKEAINDQGSEVGMPRTSDDHLTDAFREGAAAAVEFYKNAFGAAELARLTSPSGDVVAELAIDGAKFLVADVSPEHANFSPQSLGGSSVRISLIVADPDAVAGRAVAGGANLIFPEADKPWGQRQGRVVDPFGHHWLIEKPLAAAPSQ